METSVFNVIRGILPLVVHVLNKIHYAKPLIETMGIVRVVGKGMCLLVEIADLNSRQELSVSKMMISIVWRDKELYVLIVLMGFISTNKKTNVNKLTHFANRITKILGTAQTVTQDTDYQERHAY